jgi:KaiC/GvpD/RAD55 family RecA-like ATPase
MVTSDAARFKLLSPTDLENLPDPIWLIDGVLPAKSLCVLYGEPGCGKTFVGLSMALSMAAGHRWCGKPTKPGSVLYVAAEGLFGLRPRVRAYQRKHEITAQQVRYFGTGFNLLKEDDIKKVLSSLQAASFQPDLIILDTLARLIPGADENSAQDMGRAVAAIDRLRRQTSATVLLVHHTVKTGRWERGSGALRGAADVMIECSRKESTDFVSLKCDKMKDAEPFPAAKLGLQRIALSGESSSLAVIDWNEAIEDDGDPRAAWKALEVLQNEFGPNGATHKEWAKRFMALTNQSLSSFNRAIKYFKQEGAVRHEGTKYFPKQAKPKVGVKCQEVSTECHDTSHEGVISPPS